MTEDYQTSLRFSLKEAVWFKRGQEVADLLSIELNPQIGIEEKGEYIQVKGILELYGEYSKEEAEEETFSLRDFSQNSTVEEVIEREDGVYVFTHNFPIDITIPKKRVKEVEDIYILVDSFDYELPENNTLQITADISITGLYEDEQEEEREKLGEQLEEADNEEFPDGSGEVLSGEVLNEESQNESSEEKESTPILPYQSMIESIFKEFSFEARKAPVEEVEIEQEQEEHGDHSEEAYEEEQEEYELQNQRGYVEQEQHEVEDREEHPHIEFFSQQAEEEQQDEDYLEEELKTEVTVSRSENELYLTKLFGGKEENFKKVRMYIVQNGDTLESIAEKYELQVQQIARRNQLDEFYLTEGQILYLPVKKS